MTIISVLLDTFVHQLNIFNYFLKCLGIYFETFFDIIFGNRPSLVAQVKANGVGNGYKTIENDEKRC